MSADVKTSVFEGFSWLHGDLRDEDAAVFAARMKDLSSGVHKCLQMIEVSEIERAAYGDGTAFDDGDVPKLPLLSVYDTGVLLRFAITATEIIGERAEEFMEAAQHRCDKAQSTASSTIRGGARHK